MITVTKDDNSIRLSAQQCAIGSLVEVHGPCFHDLLPVLEDEGTGLAKIDIPCDYPSGIYTLKLEPPKYSGCRHPIHALKVNVVDCLPPSFPVTHQPTFSDMGETIRECCDDNPCGTGTGTDTGEDKSDGA